MGLTNKGLVEYAKKALALGNDSIYVYGTFGQELSENLINQKAKQYLYNVPRKSIYKKALNSSGKEYAFDCVGLIKAYLWGGHGSVKYKASQDKSANGMLSASKKKGKIKTMPETPGLLVHMNGHIGIYIGNGYVIECTPSKTYAKQNHKGGGVCKTKLSARKWTSWCECPYITYEKETAVTKVKKGYTGKFPVRPLRGYFYYDEKRGKVKDKGEQVKRLQKFLNWAVNAKLSVDGSLGKKTSDAIKKYQKTYGLTVDGFFGKKSLDKAKTIKK